MRPTGRRLLTIGGGAAVFCAAVLLIVFGISGNRMFYYDPRTVADGQVDLSRAFRIGGLVEPGTWTRSEDGLTHFFNVTDCVASISVEYHGLLPDLFIEGQGAVVRGSFDSDRQAMVATEVLARHDESYTPKEVEKALSGNGKPAGEYARLLAEGCDPQWSTEA